MNGLWDAENCGRPLGMRYYNGSIFVADAYKGILRVHPQSVTLGHGETQIAALSCSHGQLYVSFSRTKIQGQRRRELKAVVKPDDPEIGGKVFNDLDISPDGYIYWSDSSGLESLEAMILEVFSSGSGRLMKTRIADGKTSVLLDHLHFPNGVQISPDGSYLLLCETVRSRILKYHLAGPKKGKAEVFATLPGMPDNIRGNGRGGYLVGLAITVDPGRLNLNQYIASYGRLRLVFARIFGILRSSFKALHRLFPNSLTGFLSHR
ncbi:unnamed protein product, partial [Darwinula stevensoni]